jgi:hypothetical protein
MQPSDFPHRLIAVCAALSFLLPFGIAPLQ